MTQEILKMPYHDLVNFHSPKNLDLPKVPSFYVTALELKSEDLANITQKLKGIKITLIEGTPNSLNGIVLPDGIALNLEQVEKLVERKDPTLYISQDLITKISMGEESLDESKDQQVIQYKNALKEFDKELTCVSLWIVIHLLGHFLDGTKEFNSHLAFGKIAPPSKILEDSVEYQNLEEGYLFSYTFLGCFAKKIWEKPELMDRLFNISSIAHIPVFSTAKLQNVPCVEKIDIRNSGVFSIDNEEEWWFM